MKDIDKDVIEKMRMDPNLGVAVTTTRLVREESNVQQMAT
jgi:hypothetical protein